MSNIISWNSQNFDVSAVILQFRYFCICLQNKKRRYREGYFFDGIKEGQWNILLKRARAEHGTLKMFLRFTF